MKQNVLITGGTGLIGKALCDALLTKGYSVTILTRSPYKYKGNENLRYAFWDWKNNQIDKEAVASANAIIHLAGAGVVDKKWTAGYKKEIQDSRIKSSELIINTLQSVAHNTKTIVCASAIGWYGPDSIPGHVFTETDPADSNFLGDTCRQWEAGMVPAKAMGIKTCNIRTGIVLSTAGGALAEFMKPLRMGIAAIMGSGKQIFSWIHIDDLCRIFIQALEDENMEGSYNAVAPTPVSNKELMLTLGKIYRGSFFIPFHVPALLLKIILGDRSIEVLKSATVSCEKIRKSGFTFQFPAVEAALKNLLKR